MACFLDQMGRDGLVDARCFTHNFSGSTRCTKLERVSLFSQPFVRHSRFWYALSLGIQVVLEPYLQGHQQPNQGPVERCMLRTMELDHVIQVIAVEKSAAF